MMLSQTHFLIFVVFASLLISIITIVCSLVKKEKIKKTKQNINTLANNAPELTPQDFFLFKQTNDEFAGVYIFYNTNKRLYYIGQATKILYRVNSHLLGRGNGDVYSDYKYGDNFTIRLLGLETSGYTSLNQLEKDAILTFDSFNHGYNKTRGNTDHGSKWNFFHPHTKYASKYTFKQLKSLLKKCVNGTLEDTFDTYEEIRRSLLPYANDMDFEGIYIIHNKTKHLYYVGSSTKNIFAAIHRHFTGKGNNDIYADYQHGDLITIKTLSSGNNDYATLEELVKETKKKYSEIGTDYSKRKNPSTTPNKKKKVSSALTAEEKQQIRAQKYFDRIKEYSSNKIAVLAYNGSNKPLTAHCNECDHEWVIRADHLLMRTYCPLCHKAEKLAIKKTNWGFSTNTNQKNP